MNGRAATDSQINLQCAFPIEFEETKTKYSLTPVVLVHPLPTPPPPPPTSPPAPHIPHTPPPSTPTHTHTLTDTRTPHPICSPWPKRQLQASLVAVKADQLGNESIGQSQPYIMQYYKPNGSFMPGPPLLLAKGLTPNSAQHVSVSSEIWTWQSWPSQGSVPCPPTSQRPWIASLYFIRRECGWIGAGPACGLRVKRDTVKSGERERARNFPLETLDGSFCVCVWIERQRGRAIVLQEQVLKG